MSPYPSQKNKASKPNYSRQQEACRIEEDLFKDMIQSKNKFLTAQRAPPHRAGPGQERSLIRDQRATALPGPADSDPESGEWRRTSALGGLGLPLAVSSPVTGQGRFAIYDLPPVALTPVGSLHLPLAEVIQQIESQKGGGRHSGHGSLVCRLESRNWRKAGASPGHRPPESS